MAPRGRLVLALAFTYSGDKISQIDVIAEPGRLEALDLALLDLAGLDLAGLDLAGLDLAGLEG
jgi:RNA polymerase sigma-70 factor (ECF subfamily)